MTDQAQRLAHLDAGNGASGAARRTRREPSSWRSRSSAPPTSPAPWSSSTTSCSWSATPSATCTPTRAAWACISATRASSTATSCASTACDRWCCAPGGGAGYGGTIQLTNPDIARNPIEKGDANNILQRQSLGIVRSGCCPTASASASASRTTPCTRSAAAHAARRRRLRGHLRGPRRGPREARRAAARRLR